MNKSLRAVFILGTLMMLGGVFFAGITYRKMREQRLLHEPVRVFKVDPSKPSVWQSASLPIYQNGSHSVFFSVSAPTRDSVWGSLTPEDKYVFHGTIETVTENSRGEVVLKSTFDSTREGKLRTGRVLWFACDTLRVAAITSSTWRMSMRIISGDSLFHNKVGEFVVIPPDPEAFSPYLEHESFKLYGSGILLVIGFLVIMFSNLLTPGKAV